MNADDLQALAAETLSGLAELLESEPAEAWDAPSLCEGWRVRHVVAHLTMPARLTGEQFGAEMAAAGGDFTVVSNRIADRDASLPVSELLSCLRSRTLQEWRPPGGGAAGALSHAVIHSLDITVALDLPAVAPERGMIAVLDQLTENEGAIFGVDLAGVRLEADDVDWSRGDGEVLRADCGRLVSLVSGRTLPDGRALPRSAAR